MSISVFFSVSLSWSILYIHVSLTRLRRGKCIYAMKARPFQLRSFHPWGSLTPLLCNNFLKHRTAKSNQKILKERGGKIRYIYFLYFPFFVRRKVSFCVSWNKSCNNLPPLRVTYVGGRVTFSFIGPRGEGSFAYFYTMWFWHALL